MSGYVRELEYDREWREEEEAKKQAVLAEAAAAYEVHKCAMHTALLAALKDNEDKAARITYLEGYVKKLTAKEGSVPVAVLEQLLSKLTSTNALLRALQGVVDEYKVPKAEEAPMDFDDVAEGDIVTVAGGANGDYVGRVYSKGPHTLVIDTNGTQHRVFRSDVLRRKKKESEG